MKMSKIIIITILLYAVSSVVSFAVFSQVNKRVVPVATVQKAKDGNLVFDDKLPKTEPCPLNGTLYSTQQRQWWEKHRPLGVMIENHKEARPQSGLSSADVIYEAVAEGGITRFLVIFYCQDGGIVGPVRSARTYFLDFISEYGDYPLYAHVGGANTPGPADALSQIEEYGWQSYNDLNQFSIGVPVFIRDTERYGREVATEHTVFSQTQKLWEYAAAKRGLTNVDKEGNQWDTNFVKYKFKDDASASERSTSQTVSFDFWKGYDDYGVKWVYDKASNTYKRFNGGEKHIDMDNKKQLFAKNLVLLFMVESNANDGYENNLHMLYKTKGSGSAIILRDGKKEDVTWSKKSRTSRLILTDSTGAEVEFNRGLIWFEVVPTGTPVDIQ